jgi:hypothetical protein
MCFSQADYVEKVIAAAKALEADRLLLEGEVGRAAAWTCAACTPSFGCQPASSQTPNLRVEFPSRFRRRGN